MARINASLFWRIIGDIYSRVFLDRDRRPIEASWQTMSDLTADALERAHELKRLRGIFTTYHDLFWGTLPVQTELHELTTLVTLIGYRRVGDRWQVLVRPPAGLDLVGAPGQLVWSEADRQTWFFIEQVGELWQLTFQDEPRVEAPSSTLFGEGIDLSRFGLTGSRPPVAVEQGLRFYVEGLNWSILADRVLRPGTTQRIESKILVSEWSGGLTASKRHIQFSILGTNDAHYLRVREQSGFRVEHGTTSPTALTPTWGSLAGLFAALKAATNTSPVALTFAIEIDPSAAIMVLTLSSDHLVAQSATLPWTAQDYVVNIDVFAEMGVLGGVIEYLSSTDSASDLALTLGVGSRYTCDPPVTQASRLSTLPMRYGTRGEVVELLANTVVIEVDEEADWLPPLARMDQGGVSFELRQITLDGGVSTWELIYAADLELPDLGSILIEPWYLMPGEFWFEQAGVMRTVREIPADAELWVHSARGGDVRLWERWGALLGVPYRPDSQRYLDLLRGVYLGLHSSPTPAALSASVAWTRGIEVPRSAGRIVEHAIERDYLGAPVSSVVGLDTGVALRVPYALHGRLKPIGTLLQALEQPVFGVRVYDRLMEPELLDAKQPNVWARPSTFVVEIPDEVGVSVDDMAIIQSLIKRAKDIHTTPIIDLLATSPSEDLTQDDSSRQRGLLEQGLALGQVHVSEDMIFPDYVEVIGDSEAINPDAVSPAPPVMGGGQMGYEGLVLGSWPVTALKHSYQEVGRILGDAYPRSSTLTQDGIQHPWLADDPKAPLLQWEIDAGLTRNALRIQREWLGKPSSIVRLLNQAGDALVSYEAEAWLTAGSVAGTLRDVFFTSPWDVIIVGDSGLITRSTSWGASWSAITSPIVGAGWRAIDQTWVVGSAGAAAERTAPTTFTTRTVSGSAHNYLCVDVDQAGGRVAIGGSNASTPANGILMLSSNAGSTFTPHSFTNAIVYGVLVQGDVVWAATGAGIWVTDDFGSSWTQLHAAQAFYEIDAAGDVAWLGAAGAVYRSNDWLNLVSPSLSSITGLGGSDTIVGLSMIDAQQALAVTSTGYACATRNGGSTWQLRAINVGTGGLHRGHATRWGAQLVVGPSGLLRRFRA